MISIDEVIKMLDAIPIEYITWIDEKRIRKTKALELGTVQSAMVFLPEITRIKLILEAKKSEVSKKLEGNSA